jgi:hypothetical protein
VELQPWRYLAELNRTDERVWNAVMADAGVEALPTSSLPAELDFDRSSARLESIALQAGFDYVQASQLSWTFRITASNLWSAVVGGIATIGRAYREHRHLSGRPPLPRLTTNGHPPWQLTICCTSPRQPFSPLQISHLN